MRELRGKRWDERENLKLGDGGGCFISLFAPRIFSIWKESFQLSVIVEKLNISGEIEEVEMLENLKLGG